MKTQIEFGRDEFHLVPILFLKSLGRGGTHPYRM
jgi:hypothetical protein